MNIKEILLAKISLAFLWIFSGVSSTILNPEFGYEILSNATLTSDLQTFAIWSGGLLDVAIGLWILTGRFLSICYLVQIVVIIIYTALLTIIDVSYWLHPFGPITKNIPIIVLIYLLYTGLKGTINEVQASQK